MFDADIEDLLRRYQTTAEDRSAANAQGLLAAGLAMLGGQKGREWEAISRGGLLGLNARSNYLQDVEQRNRGQIGDMMKLAQYRQGQQEFDMRKQQFAAQQQEAQRKLAEAEEAKRRQLDEQQRLGAIFGGAPNLQNMGAGGPTPQNLERVSPPSPVNQYRQAAALMAARGNVEAAKKYAEIADKMEEEFSTTPVVGVDPVTRQPVFSQFGKKGTRKPVEGVAPPPEIMAVQLGDRTQLVDKLTAAPGSSFAAGISPDARLSADVTMRGQNMTDARSRDSNAISQGKAQIDRADGLRKEFNALPQVKSFGEVQPVIQSAREALGQDTAAADLNLIYAAAKIFDPTSVVRESETTMVVQSGSPAQRFMGQFNYVAGGGRLTPEARKQLMTQIESRARGYESGYASARKAYTSIANKQGVAPEDVFVEPFVTSGPAPAAQPSPATNKLTPDEQRELDALRKRFGRK